MHSLFLSLAVAAVVASASFTVAQSGDTLLLNVHRSFDQGCSPDDFTDPDLKVTVRRGGVVVAESFKAQNERPADWAELFEVPVPEFPVTLSFEVAEAEPGGLFGLGTSWLQCDVAQGGGRLFNVTFTGDGQSFQSVGDEPVSVDLKGFGAAKNRIAAPAVPKLTVAAKSTESLSFTWPANPTGMVDDKIVLRMSGQDDKRLTPGATDTTVTGLRENTEYRARVVRDVADWHVGAHWATFKTVNAPPPPSEINVRAGAEAAHVQIDAVAHDIVRADVHVGTNPDYQPSADTLRKEEHGPMPPQFKRDVTINGLAANVTVYVKVVTHDDHGEKAVSRAVSVTPYHGDAAPPQESERPPTPPAWDEPRNTPPEKPTPPIAHVKLTPLTARVGDLVVADATGSYDPDGSAVKVAITWGDGAPTAFGFVATHTFDRAGTFTVTATATDTRGNTDSAERRIVVAAPGGTETLAPTVAGDARDGFTIKVPGFEAFGLVAALGAVAFLARRRGA